MKWFLIIFRGSIRCHIFRHSLNIIMILQIADPIPDKWAPLCWKTGKITDDLITEILPSYPEMYRYVQCILQKRSIFSRFAWFECKNSIIKILRISFFALKFWFIPLDSNFIPSENSIPGRNFMIELLQMVFRIEYNRMEWIETSDHEIKFSKSLKSNRTSMLYSFRLGTGAFFKLKSRFTVKSLLS